jgi:hypothetical protein
MMTSHCLYRQETVSRSTEARLHDDLPTFPPYFLDDTAVKQVKPYSVALHLVRMSTPKHLNVDVYLVARLPSN